MGLINVLDTQTSNMIAAGEVVDRPASAIKEMIENAVDAGAKNITVDIKGGGMLFISVSDDGCGIMREDLPKAILRHATSKISCGADLDGIRTLGFRGEALAAISSVAITEIISKRREETFGNRLSCDETGVELYETGCPNGTTVTVRNLFYNVPARRKFMKKDSSEAAACAAVCEKAAISHPDIAISFSSDGVRKFKTSGDGKLYSVIYTLYGGDFARTLIDISAEQDGITVEGYISKPESPRGSRSMQSFFINGRFVRSKTVQAAIEEAYRSYIASGKYPAALLSISLDPQKVDVNVHPAKTEIKFADEKSVFSAVYYAVLGALSPKPVFDVQSTVQKPPSGNVSASEPRENNVTSAYKSSEKRYSTPFDGAKPTLSREKATALFDPRIADTEISPIEINPSPIISVHEDVSGLDCTPHCDRSAADEPNPTATQTAIDTGDEKTPSIPDFRIVGEAYNTFIIVELKDKLLIIDKHAAHERLIYEELKRRDISPSQQLLFPITLALPSAECELLLSESELLATYGFVLEPFGVGFAAVRAVPARLRDLNGLSEILESFAHELASSSALPFGEKADKALYTMACKAAIKAGDLTHAEDAEELVRKIFETGVKYCPHGRPFIKETDRRTLEKFFDR